MGRQERGAITVFALTLLVVVLIVALALDIGRSYVEQRALQGAADAAALAGARALASGGDLASVTAAAQQAAVLNGYTGSLDAAGVVTLGRMVFADGERHFEPGEPFTAVRIQASKEIPKSLVAGGIIEGTTTLTAVAVAHQEALGGLRVGSFLADIDTSNSALLNPIIGGLLGGNVSLNAVGYDGLVRSHISLAELLPLLQVELGVGTLEEVLTADIGLGDFLKVMAEALTASGRLAAVYLNQLAVVADTQLHLTLGELLALDTGDGTALDTRLNVFEMLLAAAQLANHVANEAVTLNLNTAGSILATLGLADLKVELHIIQPPQIAVGRAGWNPATNDWHTRARNGQVDLKVHLQALNMDLGLVSAEIGLDLLIEAAQADAWLIAIHPATPADPQHRAEVGVQTTLARIALGKKDATGTLTPMTLTNLTLLGVPVIRATAIADVPVTAPGSETLEFTGPFMPELDAPSPENTQQVGTALGAALGNALGTLVSTLDIDLAVLPTNPLTQLLLNPILDLLLDTLEGILGGVVAPLVSAVGTLVLEPLLQLLGIQLGGAEVTVIHLEPGHPSLMQ